MSIIRVSQFIAAPSVSIAILSIGYSKWSPIDALVLVTLQF